MSVVIGLGLAYAAGALSASVMFAIFNSGSRQADDELEAKELEALRARQRAVKH